MPKEKEHSLYAAAAAGDPDFINKIPADLYKKAAGQADPHAPLNQGSELFYAEGDMPEADPELIQDVEQMLKDIAREDEPQAEVPHDGAVPAAVRVEYVVYDLRQGKVVADPQGEQGDDRQEDGACGEESHLPAGVGDVPLLRPPVLEAAPRVEHHAAPSATKR